MAGCSPAGFMLHVFVMVQVNQKQKGNYLFYIKGLVLIKLPFICIAWSSV